MIELTGDGRPLADIAADFDGVETFEKASERSPSVKEVYSGYTRLVCLSKENADGAVRLILEKGDSA